MKRLQVGDTFEHATRLACNPDRTPNPVRGRLDPLECVVVSIQDARVTIEPLAGGDRTWFHEGDAPLVVGKITGHRSRSER